MQERHAAPNEGSQRPVQGALRPHWFPTPRQLFVVLLAYFALQSILRVGLSPSVDVHQAEQVLFGQKWMLGYGQSPPLYTWLQKILFAVFGESVLALALLKDLLLFTIVTVSYANAAWITGNHRVATAAALSLFFAPQFAWESQRDLTHTVLASTLAVCLLFCLLRVLERGRPLDFALLGVAAGLGLLAKYNFALWLVGLLAGTALVPRYRTALFRPWLGLSLLMFLLVVSPHLTWASQHTREQFSGIAELDLQRQSISWLGASGISLRNFGEGIGAFLAPVLAAYLLLLGKPSCWSEGRPGQLHFLLLARTFLSVTVLLLALFLIFRPNDFRERWFQPVLVSAPLLIAWFWRDKLAGPAARRLVYAAFSVMAIVAVALPVRVAVLKREGPLLYSYEALAAQLRPLLPPNCLVIGEDALTAGNLRLVLPEYQVIAPVAPRLHGPPRTPCVLVWAANRRKNEPFKELIRLAQSFAKEKLDTAPRHELAAASRYRSNHIMRWGYCILE